MQARDQTVKAMDSLQDKHAKAGLAVAAKLTDGDLHTKKKKANEDTNADNRMLFFAKVLRSATEEEVKGLFSKYGKVYDVNLFRAFQGAPTTKGCGLVTMGTHEEAVAAIEALDNKYAWDGMESPMVVKWMDAALQRRRREQHLAQMRQGLIPNMAMAPDAWLPVGMPVPAASNAAKVMNGMHIPQGLMAQDTEPTETPPAGCAPDAIKLFIGNIPKSCTEEQLLPFFETIGKVMELVIVRDKSSQESKGSAFVWYASRAQAERAILQFNLRHVLPDPTGEQDRPLVVRKAKSRNKGAHSAVNMLNPQDSRLMDFSIPAAQGLAMNPYYTKIQQSLVGQGLPNLDHYGQPAAGMNMMGAIAYQKQPLASTQLLGMQGTQDAAILYDAYNQGAASTEHVDNYMTGGALDSLGQVAMSIPLNPQQLSAINTHLYSVQTMSGASLHVSPGAPGLFHLMVSGSKPQVDAAKNLVTSVIGQIAPGLVV